MYPPDKVGFSSSRPSHSPPLLPSSSFSADVVAGFISTVPILSSLTFIQFPFRILWIPFPISSSSDHHLGPPLHSFQSPASRDPLPFSPKNLLLSLCNPRGCFGEDTPNHLLVFFLVSHLPPSLSFPPNRSINLLFISSQPSAMTTRMRMRAEYAMVCCYHGRRFRNIPLLPLNGNLVNHHPFPCTSHEK